MKEKIPKSKSRHKKKHSKLKIAVIVLVILLLVIAGLCAAIVWQITGGGVDVVDPSEVDPTAKEVKIAKEDQIDNDVTAVRLPLDSGVVPADRSGPFIEFKARLLVAYGDVEPTDGKGLALADVHRDLPWERGISH